MTLFVVLYDLDALTYIYLVFKSNSLPATSDLLKYNQDILRSLRDHLQKTQNQQIFYADQHNIEIILGWGYGLSTIVAL